MFFFVVVFVVHRQERKREQKNVKRMRVRYLISGEKKKCRRQGRSKAKRRKHLERKKERLEKYYIHRKKKNGMTIG